MLPAPRSRDSGHSRARKRCTLTFLLLSLVGLLLFVSGLVPTPWVEALHTEGLFPLYRFLVSTPLSALPFSLSEVLLGLLPLGFLVSLIWTTFGRASPEKGGSRGAWKRWAWRNLLVVTFLLDLYLLGFGWLYQRSPLAERLSLPDATPQIGAFEQQALQLARLAQVTRVPLPERVDFEELSTKARVALARVLASLQAGPLPAARIKPVWPAGLLLQFSVSGIFSPFTQEAHLDPGLDPLVLPFVAVHELAHLAGFAPEDEANFVAWLACTRSDDPWFRYSGQVAALARFEGQASSDLRKRLRTLAGKGVLADRRRAHKRAAGYRNATLSHFAWQTYDKILRSQGQAQGVKSYQLMTRLVLAWQAREQGREQEH